MLKKVVFEILNSFRIISFWLLVSFLIIGVSAAIRESKVKITIEDTVLGEKVNEYASGQEFQCVVNGRSLVVVDHEGRETGDEVQLIFRNGEYYAIRSEQFPEIGVDKWSRISFKFTDTTKGNEVFVLIAYILFTILTIKSRKDFRKKYFVSAIVTHVFGVLTVIGFIWTCFWLDVMALIVYAVVFAIFWIVWVLVKNIKINKELSVGGEKE